MAPKKREMMKRRKCNQNKVLVEAEVHQRVDDDDEIETVSIDGDEIEPVSQTPKSYKVTQDVEDILVEFFSAHTIFYDKSLKGYRDKGRKDAALEEVATKVGLTGK